MVDDYFAATYSDARGKFLAGCIEAGAAVTSYRNPCNGPQGEALYTDVGRLGNPKARGVVVVTSSTHGVEGFGGSGIQVGLLRDKDAPRPGADTALLLVHAVNPYGFAWLRRVNEDNVDLNRNFVDYESGTFPENELYDELAGYVVPATWDEAAIAACQEHQARLADKHGKVAVRKALAKGQYRYPDSTHFGGTNATWSNRTLYTICEEHLAGARDGLMIDVHTGLGPYGYGEAMTPAAPGDPIFERLHAWYGDEVHSTAVPGSAYAGSKGSILNGFKPRVPGLTWTSVGLEFGTRPRPQGQRALLGDSWLHLHGELDSDLGRAIKAQARDSGYPDESLWKALVWERGKELVDIGLRRLADD